MSEKAEKDYKEKYDQYVLDLEQWKKEVIAELKNSMLYSISKFDEQSLVISGGALALTLTFIKDIVPLEDSSGIVLLYISIGSFSLAILIGFIAHILSAEASGSIIKGISESETGKPVDLDKIKQSEKTNKIVTFNRFITCFIAVGIITMSSYSIINLNKRKHPLVTVDKNIGNELVTLEKKVDSLLFLSKQPINEQATDNTKTK